MMKPAVHIVKGKQATHTITVSPLELTDELYEKIAHKITMWQPANGADFYSLGLALRWLKKMLKKDGFPKPTQWIIYRSVNVYYVHLIEEE